MKIRKSSKRPVRASRNTTKTTKRSVMAASSKIRQRVDDMLKGFIGMNYDDVDDILWKKGFRDGASGPDYDGGKYIGRTDERICYKKGYDGFQVVIKYHQYPDEEMDRRMGRTGYKKSGEVYDAYTEDLIEEETEYDDIFDSRSIRGRSVKASRKIAKRRVMAAYDDDPNFGDIAGLAKESAYSYIVIARQGFERLRKFVDEVLNDEFNSTYRTAGTESPGDTDTSAIFTITPVSDGELLEDSALNIYYDVFGVEVGRFAGRPYRMVVKSAINDDVIAYGNTFDDIQVEVAQDIAESCRLDWDEFWGDGIESSTKITKRPIKASRPIMAGPGAGYTVEWNLDTVDSVKFIKPISTEVNEYGEVCVDAECDIEIGLTINAASSYYEGADSLDIETTATISRIYLEIPVADYETPEDVIAQIPYMGATDLQSIFYDIDALGAWKSNLGGGWIHSKFNGVLADADDPHSVSDGMEGWTITLNDEAVTTYLDKVVTGEDIYDYYALSDQDMNIIDSYENLMDAQNAAEQFIATGDYDEITCEHIRERELFGGEFELIDEELEFTIDEPADI